MSLRMPQACVGCAKRKVKCDKEIPCAKCKKRGTAQTCRRVDPGCSSLVASFADKKYGSVNNSNDGESPNAAETTMFLLRTLIERVDRLEALLQGAQKGAASDNILVNNTDCALKRARTARQSLQPLLTASDRKSPHVEGEASSAQHDSQMEVDEAATVLEFLAWGRVKDANFADNIPNPGDIQEPKTLHATGPWNQSLPSASSAEYFCTETAVVARLQEMLPNQAQVLQMFEFHKDWLMWAHFSFHAPTVTAAVQEFYTKDHGMISLSSSKLQWSALLFAVLSVTAGSAKLDHMIRWGFREDEHASRAKQWYQAAIECMNAARYQENHNLFSVQAICVMTMCAHILGFSNTQSILLASAIRIAQSLGLHRLKGECNPPTSDLEREAYIKLDTGRRVWLQLLTQDWFSLPFSETCLINPLHTTSKLPLNFDEKTFELIPTSSPTIVSYGNFSAEIATLIPRLQDELLQAQTLHMKYEQVIHFDRKMRDIITTRLPSCLNSRVPLDPTWPQWVALARHSLTITSAHKIIMIHRRFLGISLFDNIFEFTRETCLAAAKTIINEVKKEMPTGSPNIWIFQSFGVAAAIILTLDNFYRPQTSKMYQEHRNLVAETITLLSSASVSTVAVRGIRLLTDLYAEEQNFRARDGEKFRERGYRAPGQGAGSLVTTKDSKSLDVSAFVKKFCESDQPQVLHTSSNIAPQLPLWLHDNSIWPHPEHHQTAEEMQFNYGTRADGYSSTTSSGSQLPLRSQPLAPRQPQFVQQGETFTYPFGQNFAETFDVQNFNFFINLLGITPSHTVQQD